jgi:hypothetical protein
MEKIPVIIAILGLLFYWTGRWYKEWYFSRFSINFELLGFDTLYFLFGSWATVLVAILCLMIIFAVGLNFLIKFSWYWVIFSIVLLGGSMLILFFWPFHFTPNGSFFQKLLGSKDLCLIAVGLVASIGIAILLYHRSQEISFFIQNFTMFFKKYSLATVAILFVCAFLYLGFVGYIMGNYHGQSAIWEGKMGLRWAQSKGSWWILVVRTQDGRNFLFDREQSTSKVVSDNEIEQVDDFVTNLPHN